MPTPLRINPMRKDFSMGSLRSLHCKEKLESVTSASPTDDELFSAIWRQDVKKVNLVLASGANPARKGKNDLPRQQLTDTSASWFTPGLSPNKKRIQMS